MTDACTVQRVTGTTLDPVTLAETPIYSTVYTGKCRVQSNSGQVYRPEVGEQAINITRQTLQLPLGTAGLAVDDIATITSASDPDLVGRRLTLVNVELKSQATMRRWSVEERQA